MKIEETLNVTIQDRDKFFSMHMNFKDDDFIYFDRIVVERKEHVTGDAETHKFELEIVKVSDDFYVAEGHIRSSSPSGTYEKRVGNGVSGVREAIEEFFGEESINRPYMDYLVFLSDEEFQNAHNISGIGTPEEAALRWAYSTKHDVRDGIDVYVIPKNAKVTAIQALSMSKHLETICIFLAPTSSGGYCAQRA